MDSNGAGLNGGRTLVQSVDIGVHQRLSIVGVVQEGRRHAHGLRFWLRRKSVDGELWPFGMPIEVLGHEGLDARPMGSLEQSATVALSGRGCHYERVHAIVYGDTAQLAHGMQDAFWVGVERL